MEKFGNFCALFVGIISFLLLFPVDPGVDVTPFKKETFPPRADNSGVIDDYFSSHGTRVHAWLQLPANSTTLPPVVIFACGFGMQKDFPKIRRKISYIVGQNFAVYSFDYRTFGGSDGMPRHLIHPWMHVEDYVEAVIHVANTNLQGRVNGSQIFLWGTSYSGGHVLTAASKFASEERLAGIRPSLRAVLAHIPHLDGKISSARSLKERGYTRTLRLVYAGLSDLIRGFVGFNPARIPIVANKDIAELGLLALNASDYEKMLKDVPDSSLGGWKNGAAARSLFYVPAYSPIDYLPAIDLPTLVIAATKDFLYPPEVPREAVKLIGSKYGVALGEIYEKEADHFEVYREEHLLDIVKFAASFLRRNL